MTTDPLAQASERGERRRRLAEERANGARRRARTAREQAERARAAGNLRAAAVHEHEAAIHHRAVEIHVHAVQLQQQHARELQEVFGRRGGIDASGLRQIMANVRRARDEAELRGEQARTFALRARERSLQLHPPRRRGRASG